MMKCWNPDKAGEAGSVQDILVQCCPNSVWPGAENHASQTLHGELLGTAFLPKQAVHSPPGSSLPAARAAPVAMSPALHCAGSTNGLYPPLPTPCPGSLLPCSSGGGGFWGLQASCWLLIGCLWPMGQQVDNSVLMHAYCGEGWGGMCPWLEEWFNVSFLFFVGLCRALRVCSSLKSFITKSFWILMMYYSYCKCTRHRAYMQGPVP